MMPTLTTPTHNPFTPTFKSQPTSARPVQFGLATLPKVGRVTKTFDFQQLASSAVKQVMLIYAFCIFSRWGAAATRSWNELRESMVMNGLGWTGWFYTTPMLLKLFMSHAVPKTKNGLPLRKLVATKSAKPTGKGFMNALRKLNWMVNPLSRFEVFSPDQLAALKERTLHQIEASNPNGPTKTALIEKLDTQFGHALKWIRLSKGLGILMTIAFLGVGINLLNIAMTNKNIAAGRVGKNRLN